MKITTTVFIRPDDRFHVDNDPNDPNSFITIYIKGDLHIYFDPEDVDALQSLIEAATMAKQYLATINIETEKKEPTHA